MDLITTTAVSSPVVVGLVGALRNSGLYSGGKTMVQKVASVRPFRRGLWLGDPHAGAPAGVHTTAPVVHATSGDPTNSSGAVL